MKLKHVFFTIFFAYAKKYCCIFTIFSVAKMMSSDIELPLEYPAPLPWYPPHCTRFDGKTKYDHLQSIAKWNHISVKNPEREIEAAYYLHSPEKSYHEWGARVTAAMKKVG